MRFVDTNILLYAVSTAPDEERKQRIALALLEADGVTLSVQVLQEFYVQSTRSTKPERLSHDQAAALVESFLRFPVQETTVALVQAAIAARERFHISYWDAAVVEAARTLGCDTLLSEDLADGRSYDGVRVENPFRDCP